MILTRGFSMRQRMIEAIRRHFRDYGGSPSHTELHLAVGIRRNEVGRVLRQLAGDALIGLQLGVARGISLPDRTEMLSDCELELAIRARGGSVKWPVAAVRALPAAYHVDAGTNSRLPPDDPLAQLFEAVKGIEYGKPQESQVQTGGANDHTARGRAPQSEDLSRRRRCRCT
jgi:hypothetical protein